MNKTPYKKSQAKTAAARVARMPLCTVQGCTSNQRCRGFCARHYLSLVQYGDPMTVGTRRANGEGSINRHGYKLMHSGGKQRHEHILVAERALGKPLPIGAVVHHIDENKLNNTPTNLVICQDDAYHFLLHQRQRAIDACGHAHWRKCPFCKQYDAPENMHITEHNLYHVECRKAYRRAQYAIETGRTSVTS